MRAVVTLGGDAFDNERLRRYHSVFKLQDPTRKPSRTNTWEVTTCKADDDLFPPGMGPEED